MTRADPLFAPWCALLQGLSVDRRLWNWPSRTVKEALHRADTTGATTARDDDQVLQILANVIQHHINAAGTIVRPGVA